MNYTPPAAEQLFATVDTTWPPHRIWQQDGWTFRQGRGGGQRVSAATLATTNSSADIDFAERTMEAMGQPRLFMIRPKDAALDQRLDRAGYAIKDPVALLTASLAQLAADAPHHPIDFTPEPTPVAAEVWAAGGIGPARLEIMRRCTAPKTCVALRQAEQIAAVAFAAIHGGIAMCHAVEVASAHRRQGLGREVMQAVTLWALREGAETLAVLCTRENLAALALYHGMGLTEAAGYHYRIAD